MNEQRFKYGDETRAFHAVLTSYDITDLPAMFAKLDEWHCYSDMVRNPGRGSSDEPWEHTIIEGLAILRAQRQAVAAVVQASRRTIKILGHTVPCANVPGSMASDAGHLLCSETNWLATELPYNAWFSATYYDAADDKRHFSLRSPEGGADCGAIAKRMAAHLNAEYPTYGSPMSQPKSANWSGGGHFHAAGFDAPLGWDGE